MILNIISYLIAPIIPCILVAVKIFFKNEVSEYKFYYWQMGALVRFCCNYKNHSGSNPKLSYKKFWLSSA